MTDEAHTAEEIIASVLEAVRASFGKYLGRSIPSDREGARERLHEILLDSFPSPAPDRFPSMNAMQKEMATTAAVDLLEPFMCGMSESYDPRKILGRPSAVALQMLEERFRGVIDQMPFTLIQYERLRRDEKIHDWGFKRTDETNAQVWLRPLEPVEFITVKVKDVGDLFNGE